MYQANKFSLLAGLSLIFLLPVFFLPTQLIPFGIAKVLLLTIAAIAVVVFVLNNFIRNKSISIPKSHILWAALALPAAYVLSALMSAKPMISLFGYALEPGTAGFVVIMSVLFFGSAYIFRDRSSLIRALTVIFAALSLVAIFALIKVLSNGTWLTLNTFFGNMGNAVGAWTDLAMALGLLSVLTIFALEMLPLTGFVKNFMRVFYALSLVLLMVVNFRVAWMLVLGTSIVLIVYFATVERPEGAEQKRSAHMWMSMILMLFSLLFVFNPMLGSKDISTRVAEIANVSNSEVRPSLSATLGVTKKVLAESPVLGSGPNTFDKAWLKHKPAEANLTPFWNVAFPFGFGFLPTVVATTGVLGTLVWIAFFVFFFALGAKAIASNPENKSDRFMLVTTFLISLFLWVGAFIYGPSIVMLALAFIFSGLFVGASEATGIIGSYTIASDQGRVKKFLLTLLTLGLFLGTVVFAFLSFEKIVSAIHFQRALVYSNTEGRTLPEIEEGLTKAIKTSPSDQYWSAVSQIELARANGALNSTDGALEERQEAFQNALSASIGALQNAIELNPNYHNWIALANLYASLVPEPLNIDGAYESARAAYDSAEAFHPLSPEVPLLRAKLEFDNGNIEGARGLVDEAIVRKQDYAEAYFFLSQVEISQNNLTEAIESAEMSAVLSPNNAGIFFQLGLLKYSNRNYSDAELAFGRALALVPEYANAKYYLGLTLDRLGRKDEAIEQFEDLAETNPNNAAVTEVLDNLKAGRNALESVSTDTDDLPISGQ